jgi:hypothetical protein
MTDGPRDNLRDALEALHAAQLDRVELAARCREAYRVGGRSSSTRSPTSPRSRATAMPSPTRCSCSPVGPSPKRATGPSRPAVQLSPVYVMKPLGGGDAYEIQVDEGAEDARAMLALTSDGKSAGIALAGDQLDGLIAALQRARAALAPTPTAPRRRR